MHFCVNTHTKKDSLTIQTWEKIKLSNLPFQTTPILPKEVQSGPLEQKPSEKIPQKMKSSTGE